MVFIVLTFLTAFLIEGLGTLVSVIGLSTLFGSNPIIIALAVALDLGKLVIVSLLYTYWKQLNKLMKTYALMAATVTMIITSAGAAGYLAGEFQKAIIGTQEVSLKVNILKEEQAKLEARKKQIDDQIANLPSNYSRSRISLMRQFEAEQRQITDRLAQISRELPEAQLTQIGVEAKAGPILYISKAFDISVEKAVKWVILLIIFVFDPLAVFLIIAGNFLLHQRRVHKEQTVANVDLFDEPVRMEADGLEKLEAARELLPKAEQPKPVPTFNSQPDLEVESTDRVAVDALDLELPVHRETAPIFEELKPTPVKKPRKKAAEAQPIEEPPATSSLTDVKPDPSTITDSNAGARSDGGALKFYRK